MTALLIAAAALLFQQQAPVRPEPADTSPMGLARQAITEIGLRVAEVRGGEDMLRRAIYNGTDAAVVERATVLRNRCADLATAAGGTSARICRTCFRGETRAAMEQYRAALPGVVQAGNRCAAALARDLRADQTGRVVRRNMRSLSRTILVGLDPYEAAIRSVRLALGLEVRMPAAGAARQPRRQAAQPPQQPPARRPVP